MKLLTKEIVCVRTVKVSGKNSPLKEIIIQLDIDYFHITMSALKNLLDSQFECLYINVETVAQEDEELKNLIYANACNISRSLLQSSWSSLSISPKGQLTHFQFFQN